MTRTHTPQKRSALRPQKRKQLISKRLHKQALPRPKDASAYLEQQHSRKNKKVKASKEEQDHSLCGKFVKHGVVDRSGRNGEIRNDNVVRVRVRVRVSARVREIRVTKATYIRTG